MRTHLNRVLSRPLTAAVLAVAAITGISACSSNPPMNSSGGTMTSKANGQRMAAADFSAAVKKPGTIVLDVRTPAEYASGHLPQAQNINVEDPDFSTKIAKLDKNADYAVYCRSGMRSKVAMDKMAAASFTSVYDLAGGIGAWQTMGGPMVTGGP